MSWVHTATRLKFNWPERLDPREHQNWTVLEVTTSYLQGKYAVEIRIESVNKDNSHSWVTISHGLVTDLIDKEYDDNEQETSETKTEAFALKTNVLAFASRSKAKAKPRRRTSACSSTTTVPIRERIWTDIEPGTQSNLAYPVAKRLNTLRHGQLPREEDGAIEFWRLKDFNFVLTRQEKKFFISELFKVIQDAISLSLHCRTMCLFRTISSSTFITSDVRSIYTPSQIQYWYREDKIQARKDRQYSFRLWIPWTRITKIRMSLTWPNHVLHRTSRRSGKDTRIRCIGSTYSLLNEKNWSSIKQDVMQSFFTIHSQLIVSRKLLWWNLEKSCTRNYMYHLEWNNWIQKSLEAAKTPNEPNQNPKPIYQERWDPWVDKNPPRWRNSTLTSEYQDCHMQLWTKHNISEFKELVKKIESHPHREALQSDLQQNNVYNPFSNNSKAMIRELGNVELFELCETIPEVQCSHCLLYWNQGIVFCTCGQFLVESESRRKFNKLRLDALSIERALSWCSTLQNRMCGRDAARKLTLKVDILHVFTIEFSEIQFIVNHNSQSDAQNKSAKQWTNLQKKTTRIISLQRNLKDTNDNGISPWTSQAKTLLCDFDQIFELLSLSKTVSTASQANKLKNPFLQNNTRDGILLQALRGGTSLNGIRSELTIKF